eukprot:scaffold166356_cov20-Prasinocladus_malaysianus.AAC.1
MVMKVVMMIVNIIINKNSKDYQHCMYNANRYTTYKCFPIQQTVRLLIQQIVTASLQVRLSELPDRGSLRETNKVLTWHTLSKDEVKQKVRDSEARRRAQGKRMKKDQEDIEFK